VRWWVEADEVPARQRRRVKVRRQIWDRSVKAYVKVNMHGSGGRASVKVNMPGSGGIAYVKVNMPGIRWESIC
jgi:hypothetical protein